MDAVPSQDRDADLNREFFAEYGTDRAIRRYTQDTAGYGIQYLLEQDYGRLYFEVLERMFPPSARPRGVRLLEFGCGAGMNLLHLVSEMERRRIPLHGAYGTDFSPRLIDVARDQSRRYLSAEQATRVRFCVARNEHLVADMTAGLGLSRRDLLGSFHLILGVNTMRYCHRLKMEMECARALFDLLVGGGVCIMIDMNSGFPFFRSRLHDRLTKRREAYWLPTLDEYARPFSSAGFEISRRENFCWIPHSAGRALTTFLRAVSPVLDRVAPDHAMRSLVISRKPPGPA